MLRTTILTTLAAGLLMGGDANEAAKRVRESNIVLQEIMTAPDKAIPRDLLQKAHCVAIVPGMKRGAFLVGARYGKGVMLCRSGSGAGWTGPSTIRVEGGSFGLQIGGSETDIVMLVMNERGADKLAKSEFTLGADASVAAGPVGRTANANTDAWMHAKILAYSRSRGVFAGVALEGATLRSDDDDNKELYGRTVTHEQILDGQVAAPGAAQGLRRTLNHYSARKSS